MQPSLVTSLLTDLPLSSMMKVVHSVLDSLNRRRAPSREILESVDGPAEAGQVAEVADRLVKQIEEDEGHTLADMPNDAIKRHAQELLAATEKKAQADLPVVEEARGRALLDDLRRGQP